MLTVILIMTAGMAAGYLLRRRRGLSRGLDRLVSFVIYLLLFLLGLSVGGNRIIVRNFHHIGAEALMITLAAVAGSVILAALVYRFLFRREGERFREESRRDPQSGAVAEGHGMDRTAAAKASVLGEEQT